MSEFPITIVGFDKLKEEIKNLKTVERPNVIAAIASARELGDLSENAEYHAAREKQSFIETRIKQLEDFEARSNIIDISKLSGDVIKFGAIITLVDDDTETEVKYQVVGEFEANIAKKLVSINSPIAKAMIGKKVGDVIEVGTPRGIKIYEIRSVQYKELDDF
ncbi:MAG: transcription elongation factor GreA [Rickettsiaceae bacterium]